MGLQSKYAECLIGELKKDQRMTLAEEKVRLFIIATNEIEVFKVDGCIITSGTHKRCDYVACCDEYTKFIELKGIDIKHAYDQIYDTVCYFEADRELNCAVNDVEYLMGYLVSHRRDVPNIKSASTKKACTKLHSKSKSKLSSLFDHIMVVVVVGKQHRHSTPKSNQKILVSHDNPLEI